MHGLPEGKMVGHVVKADGQGYADKIELLVGTRCQRQKHYRTFCAGPERDTGPGCKDPGRWAGAGSSRKKSTDKTLSVVKGGGAGEDEIDAISGCHHLFKKCDRAS